MIIILLLDDSLRLLNVAKTKCIENCSTELSHLGTDRKTCVVSCTADSNFQFFLLQLYLAEYEKNGICYSCEIPNCVSCYYTVSEFCKVLIH